MQKLGTKKIETATFTIQNVPIKLSISRLFFLSKNQFTIQNVPIKLKYENGILIEVGDLQYRMFLLNELCSCDTTNNFHIYNTECSY